MNNRVILTFLIAILSSCGAKVIRNRPAANKDCPNISVMSNFALENFRGKWYIIYTSKKSSTENCDRSTYTLTNYKSLSIYRKFINTKGLEIKMMGVANEVEPSVMINLFPAYPELTKTYDVLETDYVNFAVLYLCDNDYNVWILSRNTTIDQQNLQLALRELKEQGLTNFYLYPTQQQNCHFTNI